MAKKDFVRVVAIVEIDSVINIKDYVVPIFRDFDYKQGPIGTAVVSKTDKGMEAVMTINRRDFFEGWPAIGGKVLNKEGHQIKEYQLTCVSINGIANVDPKIGRICRA